jgi:hypothetical protein
MDDAILVLQHEFDAMPGSFLLQLRCDLRWDKEAFNRLTVAMHTLVSEHNPEESIPRWIAEGFWYLDWFVKHWSTHANFPHEHAPAYYERAYERLHDLAFWLFVGESPYEGKQGFDAL